MNNNCFFCSYPYLPDFVKVSFFIKDGPDATPARLCCLNCFKAKIYATRSSCQKCGQISSLLKTKQYERYAVGNERIIPFNKINALLPVDRKQFEVGIYTLCNKCIILSKANYEEWIKDGFIFPSRSILTDHDIEVLRRCWKNPEWEEMVKMPTFYRQFALQSYENEL